MSFRCKTCGIPAAAGFLQGGECGSCHASVKCVRCGRPMETHAGITFCPVCSPILWQLTSSQQGEKVWQWQYTTETLARENWVKEVESAAREGYGKPATVTLEKEEYNERGMREFVKVREACFQFRFPRRKKKP